MFYIIKSTITISILGVIHCQDILLLTLILFEPDIGISYKSVDAFIN